MKTIIILDFTTGEVHIHEYPDNKANELKTAEDLCYELGYDTSNCQYMCTDKLKLTIH